ncbi:hypothetical protein TIFTF001_026679 [Ficus carica]|uniref:Uncharacterized protein n=1 Tax=Ficus carica TaxID=3494 RepID=A0AA88DLM3_FICCA|nr:hypothetical protein TIFTF001_026679 [Ficus carica]
MIPISLLDLSESATVSHRCEIPRSNSNARKREIMISPPPFRRRDSNDHSVASVPFTYNQ